MADEYTPPQGTTMMLVMGILFAVVGVFVFILGVSQGEWMTLIFLFVFSGVGVLMILLYRDVNNPNGKYTLLKTGHSSYTIVKRNKVCSSESIYEGSVNRDQPNANGTVPPYVPVNNERKQKKVKKKKGNTTGVYTYMNCPHCGSLNEVGNAQCRNCGKKL